MVNSDMFDVSDIKVLRIEGETLRNALKSNPKVFHAEDYCLIKTLNTETDFVHPEDLMIEEDRTWGKYEVQFSANGNDKTPKYFYRNNIVDQIERGQYEENYDFYAYKVKSLLDEIFFQVLKENSIFSNLFYKTPYKENDSTNQTIIYYDTDGNYYEYYNGKLTNLGEKYYVHNIVLAEIWDLSDIVAINFFTNKEILWNTLEEIIRINLDKKEDSDEYRELIANFTNAVYNKIYSEKGRENELNINLIRKYINSEDYHYYEINDELILDYAANELYLKKSRLQHYINIADGYRAYEIDYNSTETNSNILEIDNNYGLTLEDISSNNVKVEVIDQVKSELITINEDTNVINLGENYNSDNLKNVKIYIKDRTKQSELAPAENYAYAQILDDPTTSNENETKIVALNIPVEDITGGKINFIDKGTTRIFKKSKNDTFKQYQMIVDKENRTINIKDKDEQGEDIYIQLEQFLTEFYNLQEEEDKDCLSFTVEQKEEDGSISDSLNLEYRKIYIDANNFKLILKQDIVEQIYSNNFNFNTLNCAFTYPISEIKNYTWKKTTNSEGNIEQYLELAEEEYLSPNENIYYVQEGYSNQVVSKNSNNSNNAYTYEYDAENNTLKFNCTLFKDSQVNIVYSLLPSDYSAEINLIEDNKKIQIVFNEVPNNVRWKVHLVIGGSLNSNLNISIFYQTRRIKDYLLSNRRVNWNTNNPQSINYVLNRPIYKKSDGKIAMLTDNPNQPYVNDATDYYNFFEILIRSIADGGELENIRKRLAVLEQWRDDEIDPYVKRLKRYTHTATALESLGDTLTIGGDLELNTKEVLDKESEAIWEQKSRQGGSMKALDDLANYCLTLKQMMDSLAGSLIHIGTDDPDSAGKTACKVWLNTKEENGNGIFYYRTVSLYEYEKNPTKYNETETKLWIPASAIWSARTNTPEGDIGNTEDNGGSTETDT